MLAEERPAAEGLKGIGYILTDEIPHGSGSLTSEADDLVLVVIVLSVPNADLVPTVWRYQAIRAEEMQGNGGEILPREICFVLEATRFSIILASGRVRPADRIGLWGETLTFSAVQGWNLDHP